MVASSDTALVDTWFEVYVLNSIPATVAFKTPAGKTVLIVQNGNSTDKAFTIKYNQKTAPVTISGSSTATYIF